jgi:peptidoglycan/LPS O-acetylase OafA/YrhL
VTVGAGAGSAAELTDGAAEQVRSLGRAPALDGLRALAVLVVFASHTNAILPLSVLIVVPGGTVGLDPFFVLSGFLITALLLKEQARFGRIRRWAFYKRRIVRLLPPLFFLLVANVIFAVVTNTWSRQNLNSLFSVVFYYSNYYEAHSPNIFCSNLSMGYEHLWSLSFEEQFYLIWPWVVIAFLTVRRSLRTVVIVILGTIIIIGIHRGLAYQGIQSWCYEFHATEDRADALLWGCLAAHLWVRCRDPQKLIKILVWPAAIFLLAALPFSNFTGPFLYYGGFDAIDFSSAVVLLALMGGAWAGRRLFEWTPLVKLGLIAYAFYLWHVTIFFIIARIDSGWNDVLRVVVAFGWTLAMALLSWFLLEKPLQRWVHRNEPRMSTGPVANVPLSAEVEPVARGNGEPVTDDADDQSERREPPPPSMVAGSKELLEDSEDPPD